MKKKEAIQEFEKSLKTLRNLLGNAKDQEQSEIIMKRIEATELAVSALENSDMN